MASNIQETPFVKQLAANDRPTREKALSSLQTYLCSGRNFTTIELLKIWKGLFFCIFHTDRPIPQQRLSKSLASLLLPLPTTLFLPFLHAFWKTIIHYWSQIPSLRLDKYLYLLRQYIAYSFKYLQQHAWNRELVTGYLDLLEGVYKARSEDGIGALSAGDGKVPDGVRYHVLDVWVDGLLETDEWEGVGVMRPVERLRIEGRTKVVRERAREVLGDERSQGIEERTGNDGEDRRGDEEEEFEGFTE
ncbi:hypothetical protein HO173_011918 [Letharia columbiana]|uniref:Uncharacterized protein n=1 Tax=Letharia columbiana TaxID=112416 RepID=A0A8H6CR58_9LECA|nr:uncharacterized protein HO173_011918 [Letharia columbiana]KAF6227816.1 hypothetical protein HO173_011918 [Letharia columbiana]